MGGQHREAQPLCLAGSEWGVQGGNMGGTGNTIKWGACALELTVRAGAIPGSSLIASGKEISCPVVA